MLPNTLQVQLNTALKTSSVRSLHAVSIRMPATPFDSCCAAAEQARRELVYCLQVRRRRLAAAAAVATRIAR
jgi:hypothetical protein